MYHEIKKSMKKTIYEKYTNIARERNQLVTLFMLTHNRQFFVKLAIESVLEQTYENYQLFVLDNCSTDNTESVVTSFSDDRVNYVFRESLEGSTNSEFARDFCITKYFIILHDDDLLEKNYLKEVVNMMEENDFAALSVNGVLINEAGEKIGVFAPYLDSNQVWKEGSYFKQFFNKNCISMLYPSAIYRSSFFKDFEYFGGAPNAGPAGDQVIWFQTELTGGRICMYNKTLFKYRVHNGQHTNQHGEFMVLQLIEYISSEPKYRKYLEAVSGTLYKYIWAKYKTITKLYYDDRIDDEKYRSTFNYNFFKILNNTIKYRATFSIMRITFSLRKPLKLCYKTIIKSWYDKDTHNE